MRRVASLALPLLLIASMMTPLARAQESKTLVMAFSQEPEGFVAFEGGLYVGVTAANLVYATLVQADDVMRPIPDLAIEVPTIENGGAVFVGEGADQHLETTFKLRENAKWSDGWPITADDVVWTWKVSLNDNWGAAGGNDLEQKYSEVVAIDDKTVVFKMLSENQAKALDAKNKKNEYGDQRGPVVNALYVYGFDFGTVYPSHALDPLVDGDPLGSLKVKDLIKSPLSRAPISSGPYTLESWDAGVQMTFKVRDDYFRGRSPIDTIIIRGFEASKETLLAQLQAGDVQTIGSETLDVSDVDTVNAIPGSRAHVRAGTTIEHIDFNLTNPVLADKSVRQAIAYAVDRQELVNRVLSGQSQIAVSIVPPISPFFNGDTPQYVHNIDLAKQLLDGAGWTLGSDGVRVKAGKRLSLSYQSTTAGIRKKTMPLVKDQLSRVGIEVNIDQVPAQTYFGNSGPLHRGNFELGEYADVGSVDAGLDLLQKFAIKNIPSEANNFGGSNFTRWRNSIAESLIAKQSTILSQDQRKGIIDAVQLVLSEDLPTLPLYFRPNVTAASTRVVNWKPEYASNGYTWNVWEWDLQ
jgi:peptide/nickel transport system substrate-binding protein